MKKIFAANWKLHKSPAEARAYLQLFKEHFSEFKEQIVIFPTAVCWEAFSQSLNSLTSASQSSNQPPHARLQWGAQNIFYQPSGAFTGENSAVVLQQLGGQWALIGHSERRQIFGETDELIAAKTAFVQGLGLTPMLCIGETLQERQSDQTKQVLQRQLQLGLQKAKDQKPIVIAYEPVWAIGTGQVANTAQVAEAHSYIRQCLSNLGANSEVPILYGGSVKPDNANELIRVPHVGGFLVGGASLEVSSFAKICGV